MTFTYTMSQLLEGHPEAVCCALGAFAGLAAHQLLFIRGEWHIQAPQVAVFHIGLYTILPALASFTRDEALRGLFQALVWASYGYLPALLSSTLVYRIVFHPLSRAGFKGPWYATISKMWHVWACRGSQNQLVLADIHAKYGDFVRTGPSEVTIFHPDVFMAIDGPRSECGKAEWYDLLHPSIALVTARKKEIHASRRKEWNQGFTTKALQGHEQKILQFVDQLDDCIAADAAASRPSNMRDLFFWFGFDFMGDFVFSRSFGMLKNQRWHHIIIRLQRALSLLGWLSPTPWLVHVGLKLGPRIGVVRDWFDMMAWCQDQMETRLSDPSSGKQSDLTYYLMERKSDTADTDRKLWLVGDSLFAIVAGSEPTAASLIGLFSELGKQPEHAERIHEELHDVDVMDLKALTRLPYLNAVLSEAFRMYPVLMTGGNRKTSEKGAFVAGRYIPGNTTIVAPRFSIQRREDCFERPNEFLPERWTTSPEMIRNMSAYTPFGTGHHSCLGRALSTDTMRYVVARLVKNYRFRLPHGDDGSSTLRDMTDRFASNPGALSLCFERR